MSPPPFAQVPCEVVSLTGADRLDFAHRTSSGVLRDMQVGTARHALFCTKDGKLVAWCTVWCEPEALLLQPYPPSCGEAERLRQHLDAYVIMEDVQAQVRACVDLAGPAEATGIADLFVYPGRYRQLLEAAAAAAQAQRWQAAGHRGLDAAEQETLRLQAGVPDPQREGRMPLELHLQAPSLGAIAWDKGCYVGQEVISRLENFRKTARQVMGVRLAAAAAAGARLRDADGRPCGTLTSVSGTLGLALVKRGSRGTVQLEGAAGPVQGELEDRPFWQPAL